MDNKKDLTFGGVPQTLKDSHSQAQETIRREIDSLDDFEHLGHDSSPLKESSSHDLFPSLTAIPPARDDLGVINKEVETAVHKITDELSSFDPLKPSPSSFDKKMDSNLLEMGDNFPDRKEADDKLDKFLQEMGSFAPPKHQEPPEVKDKEFGLDGFKSATQNFVDFERESFQPKKVHSGAAEQLLEKYSDSEPDNDDDFKPSKYQADFPTKAELPPNISKGSEFFKDVDDFLSKPQLPKKDLALEPQKAELPAKNLQFDDKFEPFAKSATPEPVKEKAPEPVKKLEEKEKVPEKITEAVNVCKKPETETKTKKANVIDAEAIFCKMGLDAWFNPERLNPKVESLIYWRDPKKSGPVFGGVLLVLLALTYFSLISVVAYLSLLGLTGTISFRIYKNIVQAVQKTGDGHPFKDLLEFDVSLPQEKVKEVSEVTVAHINAGVVELRRLFLVEDLVDSIKFGVLLWTLTYLGAWFNGMTLIIIAWVALFTLPKVYEANKTQIDANLEVVRTKLAEITSKVKAAIPIGKKAEEKKEQ